MSSTETPSHSAKSSLIVRPSPVVAGFDLKRLVVDEDTNATLVREEHSSPETATWTDVWLKPYYVENTKDLTQITRVVITTAGIWRKYALSPT